MIDRAREERRDDDDRHAPHAHPAPVSALGLREGAFRVTFAMPAGYTLETLPEPEDPRVKLEVVPAHDVAAIRFSGWARTAAIQVHSAGSWRGPRRGVERCWASPCSLSTIPRSRCP